VGIDEAGEAMAHVDLDALVGLQGQLAPGPQHVLAVGFQGGPVQLRRVAVPTTPLSWIPGPVADDVRRVAPGLGGDAAAPEAFAPGQGRVVDHGDLDAVVGQVAGAVLAAGAAADDGDLDVPFAGGNCGDASLLIHVGLLVSSSRYDPSWIVAPQ
jgi:hypothetical protein